VTAKRSDRLVREMLNLYSKYGRSEFEKAIRMLESGESIGMLLRLMRTAEVTAASANSISGTARRSVTKKKKSSREGLAEFLSDLSNRRTDDPDALAQFVSDIAERKLLPSAALLREYYRRLGFSTDSKMDRAVLAKKIGQMLLDQSPEVRRNHMEVAVKMGTEKSSLQAWSDVIVKQDR
jgi:hypothetical protein